ncbi:MAG: NeuD/PglB/VioB family sugar acetyltransferase [Clostridia bacterium]|nr:NeuD/PglB/VioB family sugar acetyltransferase [Clostridia bacterium]
MKEKVILVGGYHEIIELSEDCGYKVVGIIDNDNKGSYCNIPIIGKDSDAISLFEKYKDCKVVICPHMPMVREKLYKLYSSIGYKFATLVSPNAHISRYATVGEGSVIQGGVNIAANTNIGSFVKLNTNANIMHDDEVEDFVTVAPDAVALGYVRIKRYAFIGANSTILPNITIGTKAIVGAGAVVTKDIEDGRTVKGIPAK